jgi:hypothetical protein
MPLSDETNKSVDGLMNVIRRIRMQSFVVVSSLCDSTIEHG